MYNKSNTSNTFNTSNTSMHFQFFSISYPDKNIKRNRAELMAHRHICIVVFFQFSLCWANCVQRTVFAQTCNDFACVSNSEGTKSWVSPRQGQNYPIWQSIPEYIYETYTKSIYIKLLPNRNQNYPIHPLGAASRPPKGILLSLASFGSQINQVSCIFPRYIEEGELPR